MLSRTRPRCPSPVWVRRQREGVACDEGDGRTQRKTPHRAEKGPRLASWTGPDRRERLFTPLRKPDKSRSVDLSAPRISSPLRCRAGTCEGVRCGSCVDERTRSGLAGRATHNGRQPSHAGGNSSSCPETVLAGGLFSVQSVRSGIRIRHSLRGVWRINVGLIRRRHCRAACDLASIREHHRVNMMPQPSG